MCFKQKDRINVIRSVLRVSYTRPCRATGKQWLSVTCVPWLRRHWASRSTVSTCGASTRHFSSPPRKCRARRRLTMAEGGRRTNTCLSKRPNAEVAGGACARGYLRAQGNPRCLAHGLGGELFNRIIQKDRRMPHERRVKLACIKGSYYRRVPWCMVPTTNYGVYTVYAKT